VNAYVAESRPTVHVVQGGHAVGRDPDVVIGTILGSCVAACLWDPEARIGGMNHIVLPEGTGSSNTIDRHGASDMERLINALQREGAARGRLRAKAFGGANMIAGLPDIGKRNVEFLMAFLTREGIPVDGSSLGGNQARMIRFWPHSGRARQRLVDRVDEPGALPPLPVGNDVELF
jgi:chemotaxis protein CheD